MKNVISILSLVLVCFAGTGQEFTLRKSLPVSSQSFTTDHLGNIYLISGTTLNKYGPDGLLLRTYSNKNLGTISQVDASNPMKVLLFFAAFQQIVLLDNMLSPTSDPLFPETLGYSLVSLACSSHNNGLWLYTPQNSMLIRLDQNFQQTSKTENIAGLAMREVKPDFMLEQNNKLFLNDSTAGILVFDIYGTYSKTIPIKGLRHFQVDGDELIYFKDGKLKNYNMKTLAEGELKLPDLPVYNARTEKEKLYLLKQKSLDIYNVKK